ncbi:MAG TPA: gentisate 1,2-dioxygenase [Gammaproteobacteria bacterium]|nr:gentisate 1,2-dioxygenase [Gammaproteobacteria bacterium]MCH78508.1 gentisate 1,2-dioxygenase [Gammaproteobacteria bacterium]
MDQKVSGDVRTFINSLKDHHLGATWEVLAQAVPVRPQPAAVPFLWPYRDVREQLLLAGDLVPAEQAERRTLCCCNPGLGGAPSAVSTLFADIQLVLPGEVASTHRHAACAVRFMLEGEGSFALAAGERISQVPGDMVIGPSWAWHSHSNEGPDDAIWFDCLDAPLTVLLDGSFFQPFDRHEMEITRVQNASSLAYGHPGIAPTWQRESGADSPLLKYSWVDANAALAGLPEQHASPYDAFMIEYTNPVTGGPCMPTVACHLQRLPAGCRTEAHRHTANTVYLGVEGEGRLVIDGQRFDWQRGDVIALPTWAAHHHENCGDADAILFSVTDAPVFQKLGLYREETVVEQ